MISLIRSNYEDKLMATAKKILTAVNEVLELGTPNEEVGGASFQVPAAAAGTYVMESTIDGVTWAAVFAAPIGTGVGSAAAVGPGIYQTGVIVSNRVRVRKVTGVAAETITLTITDY